MSTSANGSLRVSLTSAALLLAVGWITWVTVSIFELKGGAVMVEGREVTAVLKATGVEQRLSQIQNDIAELKILVAGHTGGTTEKK